MIKVVQKSVIVIQNVTSMWKGRTITAAKTILSLTKESRKKKSIRAMTVTSGGGDIDMIIDVLPTIAVDRPDLGARHRINIITRKVPRMNGAKSLIENIATNPVITDDFSKHGKSNPHL